MRDDFIKDTKERLALRVCMKCSICVCPTSGPADSMTGEFKSALQLIFVLHQREAPDLTIRRVLKSADQLGTEFGFAKTVRRRLMMTKSGIPLNR